MTEDKRNMRVSCALAEAMQIPSKTNPHFGMQRRLDPPLVLKQTALSYVSCKIKCISVNPARQKPSDREQKFSSSHPCRTASRMPPHNPFMTKKSKDPPWALKFFWDSRNSPFEPLTCALPALRWGSAVSQPKELPIEDFPPGGCAMFAITCESTSLDLCVETRRSVLVFLKLNDFPKISTAFE